MIASNPQPKTFISISQLGFKLSPRLVKKYGLKGWPHAEVLYYPRTSRLRFRFVKSPNKRTSALLPYGKTKYILNEVLATVPANARGRQTPFEWPFGQRGSEPDLYVQFPR